MLNEWDSFLTKWDSDYVSCRTCRHKAGEKAGTIGEQGGSWSFMIFKNTVQLRPLPCLHQGSPIGIDLIDIKKVLDPL